ncbi:MAG: hypothetical protein Fur0037_12990 [Planctomycetota bacterium]
MRLSRFAERGLFAALCACLCAHTGAAQDDPSAILGRLRRSMQENQWRVDRLMEARMRHDLGLPVRDAEDLFQSAGEVSTESLEKARRDLQNEDAAARSLLQRFRTLKEQVARLQAEAAARAASLRAESEWVTVPRAGTRPEPASRTPPQIPLSPQGPASPPQPAASAGGDARAAPAAETAPARTVVIPNLPPPRGQIQGSRDHALVAQALYRAAEALVERGSDLRARGLVEAADQCDAEAKDRLDRALDSLAEAQKDASPSLAALFCLGKCREMLFRLAERHEGLDLARDPKEYQRRAHEVRDPFVAIVARDVSTVDGKQVPGIWGLAAQAALDHFAWMNLNAGFKPRIPLESITWESQKE